MDKEKDDKLITGWFQDDIFLEMLIRAGMSKLIENGTDNDGGIGAYIFNNEAPKDAAKIAEAVRYYNSDIHKSIPPLPDNME